MEQSGKNICGAKTRDGDQCQNSPVNGSNRCRMHGGKSLKGLESRTYKHGLYSKYAGKELEEVLDQLADQSTEELCKPDNEIKLMQALITKCEALKDGYSDLQNLDRISKVVDALYRQNSALRRS